MNKLIQIFCLLLIVFSLNTGVSTSVFSDYETLEGNKIEVLLAPVELDFYLARDQKSVGFRVGNIGRFARLNYTVTYNCLAGDRQIAGEADLNGEINSERENLLLGACSKDTCVYDEGISSIRLSIGLIKSDGERELLEREITL